MTLSPFISAISLAVLLFLTIVLLTDNKRPRGTVYLVGLMVLLSLVITLRLCVDLASPLIIYLPFVVFPAGLLYAPFIFLYTQSALFARKLPRSLGVLLFAVPFLILVLHAVLYLHFAEMRDLGSILRQEGIILNYTLILVAAGAIYSFVFLTAAWISLRRYERAYQENFAGNDRDQLTWLKTFVVLNLLLAAGFAGAGLFMKLLDLKVPATPVEGIIALIMIYVILYYFIRKPAIFTLPATVAEGAPRKSAEKYKKQNLSDAERGAYMQKIEKYLAEEKPFLDDKVTLSGLAAQIGIPAHHFSMVINIERQTNFYHFINSYRAEEAKSLLRNPDMADETILDIALMAGFQSKAAFNKVFKEITGSTPSAYREQNDHTAEKSAPSN